MNRVLVASAVLGVATTAIVGTLMSQPAEAFTPPLSQLEGLPAVGPAYLDSFKTTCGAAATLIRAPAGPNVAVKCTSPQATEANAAVFVAWGDSGIGMSSMP